MMMPWVLYWALMLGVCDLWLAPGALHSRTD
jgi:hypothetical protein